jgi:FKBP-type peptidyl-prolyl cis-trans isomerase FkpA
MNRTPALFLAAALVACAAAVAEEPPQTASAEPAAASPAAQQKQQAEEFLAKLDAEKDVQKKPSGLRIKMVKEGTGANPVSSDTVKVNYRGTLLDGKEFDSSYKRGTPATFALTRVIACWTEGLQLMKPGGKALLYCPSQIAYGDRGYSTLIPPGALLTFDVELLGIEGASPAPAPTK